MARTEEKLYRQLESWLYKNQVPFSRANSDDIDIDGILYHIRDKRFGLCQNNKINLLAVYEEIAEMCRLDHNGILLRDFRFEPLPSDPVLGQYLLRYVIIPSKPETQNEGVALELDHLLFHETQPLPDNHFDTPETITEAEEVTAQIPDTAVVVAKSEVVDAFPAIDTTPFKPSPTNENDPPVYPEVQRLPDELIFETPDRLLPEVIPPRDYAPVPVPVQTQQGFNYFKLQDEVQFLLNLLVKGIHPEKADLIAKAVTVAVQKQVERDE